MFLLGAKSRFLTRFQDPLAADPRLAADLVAGHRYNAACSAALAASGKGDDAATLDDVDAPAYGCECREGHADVLEYTNQSSSAAPFSVPRQITYNCSTSFDYAFRPSLSRCLGRGT